MGQAWCKEKTTKAQDSKSPLDRVFVRCMHRIYPSLKEEGSVLGGATQRVTSSEIGYAGSPPREALTRGRSIDSVDRPFHPSDWVDVNLEVPSTPRASSALTNLTVDTSLYPAATPTSSCPNLKDVTPVPPPRRRKRNKGRPLPPKPDEISAENSSSGSKRHETGDEPLYSSVRSPRSSGDEQDAEEETRTGKHRSQDDAGRDGSGAKEIYEHKVNGTGRIISSDVVSGKRPFESSQQHQRNVHESEEYERFARSRTDNDSSTPNREEKRRSREIERQTKDSSRDHGKSGSNARPKNFSTVSLPNYDELDVARHRPEENDEHEQRRDKTRKARRPVRSSTGSLPAESFLSPFSEKTSVRLEDYIPRSDNLSPYQIMEKLNRGANSVVRDEFVRYDSDKPEDWELDDEVNRQRCFTLEDTSDVDEGSQVREDGEDVVDFSRAKSPKDEGRSSSPLANKDVPALTIHLEKPEAFGKTASPFVGQPEYAEVDPNRSHLKYDPPKLTDSCRISCARESSVSKEPFFLDEAKHRSALGAIGGPTKPKLKPGESRTTFANEIGPSEDTCESKGLHSQASNLIRTISEESLPREMLEEQELDDFFDEKLAKDVHNNLKKSLDDWKTKTPPPSPEPKVKPANTDSDHSTLLKVLKDETAEESNLSSMTPSLTELEAALSDMLEKEDSQEGSKDETKSSLTKEQLIAKEIEPETLSSDGRVGNENPEDADEVAHEIPTSLKQILEEKKLPSRKVSFCAWEEFDQASIDQADRSVDVATSVPRLDEDRGVDNKGFSLDVPPEKPSRLNRSLDDLVEDANVVPTPPRRRNRSLCAAKKEPEVAQNGTVSKHLSNDRLI
ncbi:uncharacterized protein LOC122530860 isoform X2 [Frieseomelitta varia]|uniref:uncharacterized protein LOC122530860 isoform X2 n=1 Tax=Frieseomelitta varia TaxID=561572 RepID=UPI001CB69071|nr:uncharacterized protein LOC122530860 isoform X2 [Frieseomelitta varia]